MVFTSKKYNLAVKTSLIVAFSITSIITLIFLIPYFLKKDVNELYHFFVITFPVILFVIVFLYLTRKFRRRKKILQKPFPQNWENILNSRVAYYLSLGDEEKTAFKKQIQIFLNEKMITGIQTEIDDETRVLVAVSAVIPIFKFPDWEYNKLDEILIYPANFDREYNFSGRRNSILGMVMSNSSTIILSKPALFDGFWKSKDGLNVGIHEFIHKIDHEDGLVDGIPNFLMTREIYKRWIELVDSEMKKIEKGKSDINSYALTNKAEFFSVVSEYFFENPAQLENKHPELYALMTKIFRQDTKSQLKSVVRTMFMRRPKKIGRNSPCPCGSGRKYKKCCLK
jgi:Mlc titration factor MtfA (ptsG expression regulator)